MQNFLGCFECTLDSKGRLMIPAKFRRLMADDTGGTCVITVGKERCLNLFPMSEWNEIILKKLHELEPGPHKRKIIRFYSEKSRTLNIDKTGRIAIPPNFMETVGNSKRVVVVGALNYMEIWAPEDYEKTMDDVQDSFLGGDWEY